ncbi:GGDEF domain-containing protein [Actinoplanes sp. NPDC026619]|uniref:GGDEF domain-containing protein n=1 Tax=Actinoplanes sp. NPDC026619 TaxID=3155798 RepID=UPI0033EB297E
MFVPVIGKLPDGISRIAQPVVLMVIIGGSWALVSILNTGPARVGYAPHLIGSALILYAAGGLLNLRSYANGEPPYGNGSAALVLIGTILIALAGTKLKPGSEPPRRQQAPFVWMLVPYLPVVASFTAALVLVLRSGDGGVSKTLVCVLLGTSTLAMARQLLGLLVIRDQAEHLDRQREALNRQAHHDSLTGLPNRAAFHARAAAVLATADADHLTAVLLLDLDGFKPVNDTFGHAAGDALLIEVGRRLTEAVRPEDTVARLGGDEFVLLLPGLTDPGGAEATALRLLHRIAEPIRVGDDTAAVTASIGITVARGSGHDLEPLVREADIALYSAKAFGKNMFRRYEEAWSVSSS